MGIYRRENIMAGRFKISFKKAKESGGRDSGDGKTPIKSQGTGMLKLLREFAIPYWYLFILALIIILISSAISLARPYLIKIGIDDYIQLGAAGKMPVQEARKGLYYLGILYLAMVLAEFVFGYLQHYILQYTGMKIIYNIRKRVFDHVQHLPLSYFDTHATGRIVTRITNDPGALNEMFSGVLIGFLKNIFVMIGIVVVMFRLSFELTIITFLVLPLIALASILFRTKARKVFREMRAKLSAINAFMSEHIMGMKIIQAFNMQQKKFEEFDKINKEYYNANMQRVVVFGIFRPFMDVVRSLAVAILLWYGGRNILAGSLEFGTLYVFIDYIGRFFQPIMELTEEFNTLQSSMVSAERILNILGEEPEKEPEGEGVKRERIRGEIEFKNVWFAYQGDNWVLKDVSFKVEPGQSVAFVGATGAGKTSIINLLCGFYEHQKGQILIDGIDIRDMKKSELRKHIGLVLQDVNLFYGDIETNIKLFNENISSEEVKQAAKYVNADGFIRALPGGYKHVLSEGGTTLSAGQRQLISFARALVKDPEILIMDEATSNIHTETEGLIQDALGRLMKGRTTIAIAHRLSTIQKADQIIVIHRGRIREKGNHQELLRQKGLYYNLYKLQYENGREEVTA